MVEVGGIGEGTVATAAEVVDSSSTGRCNGRRYSSSVAITRDIGAGEKGGGVRCRGSNGGINVDVLVFRGQGLGRRQILCSRAAAVCLLLLYFWH